MSSEELTIRGSLAESSLMELLSSISRSHETGVLNFHDVGRWKAVYFNEGQIVYATSNVLDDRLGEFLLKQGKITVRQFLDASKLITQGKRLGAVLVDQEILSPDELIVAIQLQVQEIVYSLFEWTQGEYEFVMKDLAGEGPITLDLNTENVILEGIRRIKDFSRVFSGFGSIDTVLRRSENAEMLTYKLELSADESQVLSLVNGRLTLEQVLALSYLSNFETLRILFGLVSVGVLERGGGPERDLSRIEREQEYELEEIVDHYQRSFTAVYGFLEERLGEHADVVADRVVEEVSKQFPALFEGINLSGGVGRVDFDQLLANLGKGSQEEKRSALVNGLNELTYALLLTIGQKFGREDQDRVASQILSLTRPSTV